MKTTVMTLALGCVLFSVGSALVAAPEQGPRPGDMSPANVWVQNRGPGEAIPVSLQELAPSVALRVQVAGTTPTRVENIVLTRPARAIWDYREVRIASGQDPVSALTSAGADGWETTGLDFAVPDATVVVLKRPR